MKAAPSARSWVAAGVRHELLMRALPAVRHDLAAPLSLMRMQLLLLRRHAQTQASGAEVTLASRVTQLEGQVSELSQGLRGLREWEWPSQEGSSRPGLTRESLVEQAAALMRATFELNGIALEVAPELAPLTPQLDGSNLWPDPVGLRYLLLGALCHLHDAHEGFEAGGRITLAAVEDWGVRLQAHPRVPGEAGEAAPPLFAMPRSPRHLAIDVVSLQALADDLGHAVVLEADALTLDLRLR